MTVLLGQLKCVATDSNRFWQYNLQPLLKLTHPAGQGQIKTPKHMKDKPTALPIFNYFSCITPRGIEDPPNLKLPLKSTSPFPSASNISITRWTSGFCCNSGSDINSSILKDPELSRSSFRKRFPSLRISSASTVKQKHIYCENCNFITWSCCRNQ